MKDVLWRHVADAARVRSYCNFGPNIFVSVEHVASGIGLILHNTDAVHSKERSQVGIGQVVLFG